MPGPIQPELRSIVSEATRLWEADEVYVGCSGDFTIERILAGRGFKLHSNDVSIYSCVLGCHLASQDMRLDVVNEEFAWLRPYVEDGASRVATMLLCTTMLGSYGKELPYHQRQMRAYRDDWVRLHARTLEKVHKSTDHVRLESFTAGDVVDFAEQAPRDAPLLTFPPTSTSTGGWLHKAFGAIFDWDPPHYQSFDETRLGVLLDNLIRRPYWMLAREEPLERLQPWHIGLIQTSLRNKPLWVYGTPSPMRLAMPHLKMEQFRHPRVTEETVITADTKVQLARLNVGQFNIIRAAHLNPNIAPVDPQVKLGVFLDGVLAGILGFNSPSMVGNSWCDAYMMTDLPLRPTRYPRLSKLILAMAKSKEVQLLLEGVLNQRIRLLGTTAFTERATSMKYRGLFEVYGDRKPGRVNYTGTTGEWTMQEALTWWLNNYVKEKPAKKKKRQMKPRDDG